MIKPRNNRGFKRGAGVGASLSDLQNCVSAMEREVFVKLGPRDQWDSFLSKERYQRTPLYLDDCVQTMYDASVISNKENVVVIGSGYHRVQRSLSTARGLHITNSSNVTIRGIRFVRGVESDSYPLVHIQNSDHVKFVDCIFECEGYCGGITAETCNQLSILDCEFYDSVNRSLIITSRALFIKTSEDVIVSRNRFSNCADTVLDIDNNDCTNGIITENHLGTGLIRYNGSGNHQVALNQALLFPY